MQKIFFLLSFLTFAFLTGCSSSPTSPTNNNTNPNATDSTSYLPLSIGSTWTYTGSKPYTVTMLRDTTYNGKSWRTLNNSGATGIGFVRKEGTVYINFSPTGVPLSGEFTGLNEAPGSTWSWDLATGQGVTTHYVYTNAVQGLTRMVLGKNYSNVIDVRLDYTVSVNGNPIQTGTGHYYYARGIGMIDADLGALGGSQLSSYSIK